MDGVCTVFAALALERRVGKDTAVAFPLRLCLRHRRCLAFLLHTCLRRCRCLGVPAAHVSKTPPLPRTPAAQVSKTVPLQPRGLLQCSFRPTSAGCPRPCTRSAHGLQLQSLWVIPTAAVSEHVFDTGGGAAVPVHVAAHLRPAAVRTALALSSRRCWLREERGAVLARLSVRCCCTIGPRASWTTSPPRCRSWSASTPRCSRPSSEGRHRLQLLSLWRTPTAAVS